MFHRDRQMREALTEEGSERIEYNKGECIEVRDE